MCEHWFMLKAIAIELLGGTVTSAARAIGITHSAVSQWPEVLPKRISDRVQYAAIKASRERKPAKAKKELA